MTCTWKGCKGEALHPQHGANGSEWAVLCLAHHELLDAAIDSGDARRLLGAWANAGYGHPARKELKEAMAKGVVAVARAFKP